MEEQRGSAGCVLPTVLSSGASESRLHPQAPEALQPPGVHRRGPTLSTQRAVPIPPVSLQSCVCIPFGLAP